MSIKSSETSKSDIGEIWRWSFKPSQFKVWINPKYQAIRAKIQRWRDTKQGAIYFYPNKAVVRDLIIPARYFDKVAKLLGLPPRQKHPKQVAAGKASKISLDPSIRHRFT